MLKNERPGLQVTQCLFLEIGFYWYWKMRGIRWHSSCYAIYMVEFPFKGVFTSKNVRISLALRMNERVLFDGQ